MHLVFYQIHHVPVRVLCAELAPGHALRPVAFDGSDISLQEESARFMNVRKVAGFSSWEAIIVIERADVLLSPAPVPAVSSASASAEGMPVGLPSQPLEASDLLVLCSCVVLKGTACRCKNRQM